MSAAPEITLHVLPPSHPSLAAEAALRLKGIEFERVEMEMGRHNEQMEAIYGAGNRTVPGIVVDGEPVQGSREIFARLEEIVPLPAIYP
jgi:glutathione S-transferase